MADMMIDFGPTVPPPLSIKRHGKVGFRGYTVEFLVERNVVKMEDDTFHTVEFPITDFLNLVEMATWYYDTFTSREER